MKAKKCIFFLFVCSTIQVLSVIILLPLSRFYLKCICDNHQTMRMVKRYTYTNFSVSIGIIGSEGAVLLVNTYVFIL